MTGSLKHKTAKGLFWGFVEQIGLQVIHFIVGILLARLLSPSDYGMVGMLTVFIAISQAFVNSGFDSALIRKQDRTNVDDSTVFYFNIFVGVFMYLILFVCSPFIASFYDMPELEPLTKVIALPIIINSFNIVQNVHFTTDIDFKTLAKISVAASICSGIVGIALAFGGYGVWALVYSQIARSLTQCVLLWIASKWRPIAVFSMKAFREMFSFGSKLLLSGLIDTIYKNIYPLIIGKFYSAATLGYYSRANGYAQMPSTTATGLIRKVTFPVLCKVQDNDEALISAYRRILRLSTFIIFPIMMGLAALSRPLILCLITDKWEQSILLLQILCFASMWYPVHALNLNLLTVKGRSDLFLKLEVIKKILGVSVLIISVPFGITALCIGSVVTSIIALGINTYYTGKLVNFGIWKQLKDMLPSLLLSLFMALLIVITNTFISNGWIQIITGLIIGVIFYFGVAILLGSEDLKYMKSLVKEYIKK
jgi:teichuronic acid exporter